MVIKFGIFTTKIIFFRWNFLLKTSQALKWVSNVLQIWNMSNVLHQWDFWNFRIYPKKHHRKGDYLALILENYTRAKTKMGTFGKSDCFWTTKMALLVPKSKFYDHFYSLNITHIWPLWLLFPEFITFGSDFGQISILFIIGPILGIFGGVRRLMAKVKKWPLFLEHFPNIDNDNDLLSLYSFQKLLRRVTFQFQSLFDWPNEIWPTIVDSPFTQLKIKKTRYI